MTSQSYQGTAKCRLPYQFSSLSTVHHLRCIVKASQVTFDARPVSPVVIVSIVPIVNLKSPYYRDDECVL